MALLVKAVAAILLIGASAAGAAPLPHDFTLEQILSAPFPSDLIAAPAGGRVAWVFDDKGARNVWVAEPGASGFTARPVTSFSGDKGVDLGEISWAPDGRTLAFSRGGSLEGGGPVNITSNPAGPKPQTIWLAALGAAPREVGPGHGAAISPKNDVAYLSEGQIWTAPLAGGPPTQRVHDRGQDSGLTWSPDGARLAFVSNRGDHSLIGVLDLAADTITWLQPSVDTDAAPEWSPDGRRIAFVRTPAGQQQYFVSHKSGPSWSIWVADVATGIGHSLWSADPGPGSVFHPTLGDRTLMWTAGDQLAFPWEKTGWVHLYAIPATGGAPRDLTTGGPRNGAFEVFNTALSPDGRRVVYSANATETDRWSLWQVEVAGGAPQPVTAGPTIEDYPVVSSTGQVFALHSDARNPMQPVAVAAGRMTPLAPGAVPKDFPAALLVQPEGVTFTAADGQTVHGQLFLPPPGRAHRGPAVLFFHGGPVREMLLGWHPMDAYSYMYAMNQYLANEGYVVLSVNYRGGIGYGLNWREAENFGAGGASELNDLLGAAAYLKTRPDVDPARIGLYGASYGGLMTALGLSRASNLLAAGVDYAGVHDWRTMRLELPPSAQAAVDAQRAFDSSAMATLDRWTSPVLLVHADDDRNVPFSQTTELVSGLRAHHIPFEQIVIPDEIHDLLREASWLTLLHATDDFFARKLRP
jgi:dipeptidyl aminopeptidase/acylaminoacyl peptidase